MYIEGKLNAEVQSGGGGTTDYNDLSNKPQINGISLSGNKTTSQLGINVPTKTSDLANDSGYITNEYVYSKTQTNSLLNEKQDNLNLSVVNGQICITYEE
jgi:hypothetical protein